MEFWGECVQLESEGPCNSPLVISVWATAAPCCTGEEVVIRGAHLSSPY